MGTSISDDFFGYLSKYSVINHQRKIGSGNIVYRGFDNGRDPFLCYLRFYLLRGKGRVIDETKGKGDNGARSFTFNRRCVIIIICTVRAL